MKESLKTDQQVLLGAGLIYGNFPHYVDHLAPLCHLLDIPLVVSDPLLLDYQQYYPETRFLYKEPLSFNAFIFESYEILFSCYPRILLDSIFTAEEMTRGKRISTVWCSHGHSDKGRAFNAIDALKEETYAMFYGQRMLDYFTDVCSFKKTKKHVITGNYRYEYFKKFSAFYNALISEKFGSIISQDKKTLLYAPTWNDIEDSCSISSASNFLIQNLPEHLNLLIKPHPLTSISDTLYLEHLIDISPHKQRIFLIENFTPIYPLLDICDCYLGDMSSVGYDFLTFDRPLFFINHNKRDLKNDPGLHLHNCGISITPENFSSIYNYMKEEDSFSAERKSLYKETFCEKPLDVLKQELQEAFLLPTCKADLLSC